MWCFSTIVVTECNAAIYLASCYCAMGSLQKWQLVHGQLGNALWVIATAADHSKLTILLHAIKVKTMTLQLVNLTMLMDLV